MQASLDDDDDDDDVGVARDSCYAMLQRAGSFPGVQFVLESVSGPCLLGGGCRRCWTADEE